MPDVFHPGLAWQISSCSSPRFVCWQFLSCLSPLWIAEGFWSSTAHVLPSGHHFINVCPFLSHENSSGRIVALFLSYYCENSSPESWRTLSSNQLSSSSDNEDISACTRWTRQEFYYYYVLFKLFIQVLYTYAALYNWPSLTSLGLKQGWATSPLQLAHNLFRTGSP